MGSNLKWDKHNKLEVARDFRQGRRKYLYSEIEDKETDMEITCGMCEEVIEVTKDLIPLLKEGILCVPCQEYTMGYLFPEMPEVVKA